MPLSNVEREVLEVIHEEHRQTRRGAKALIVHVGMNAKTGEQKARVTDVLHALQKRGLVMLMDGTAWIPSREGEAALGDVEATPVDTPTYCSECNSALTSEDLSLLDRREFKPEEIKAAQEAAASKWADDMTRLIMGTDRISDDLLNRCAAMNATLLAQAEKAHAAGDADAWRDLAWLMETGRQLVAVGGGE